MERKKNTPLTLNDKVVLLRKWEKLKLTLETIEHLAKDVIPKLEKEQEFEVLIEVQDILKSARNKKKSKLLTTIMSFLF